MFYLGGWKMHKPKKIILKGKLLDMLWNSYLDSLELEKKKDLTSWGKGELFILKKMFANQYKI